MLDAGVIEVIRGNSKEQAVKIIDAAIKDGAVAVGTGSNLTKGAATGDYEAVEKEDRRFVEVYKKAKRIEVK